MLKWCPRPLVEITLVTAAGLLAWAAPALAVPVQYSDEAAFVAATTTSKIDFEGIVAPGVQLGVANPYAVGGITITDNAGSFVRNLDYFGTGTFYTAQGATPTVVTITLPAPARAFCLTYFSLAGTVDLGAAGTFNLPAATTFPNELFFGIVTDAPSTP